MCTSTREPYLIWCIGKHSRYCHYVRDRVWVRDRVSAGIRVRARLRVVLTTAFSDFGSGDSKVNINWRNSVDANESLFQVKV